MVLNDVQATIQECKALSLHEQAIREAREKQKALLAELASLDQQTAEHRVGRLESVTKMTDATVAHGRKLVERLVLLARLTQQFNETTREPNQAAELELADQRDVAIRSNARDFLASCGEALEVCLETLAITIDAEDVQSASLVCQQAQRLTKTMREIQGAWPWIDEQGVNESWRQYRRGELMDFEAFKHALLKAAK